MQPRSNTFIFTSSLMQALCDHENLAQYFIHKHHLNVTDEWIPTSSMIDCLFHIEEKVGSHTLKRIGANIAHAAPMPAPSLHSFDNFLVEELNEVYKLNHQRLTGGFKVSLFENKYVLDLKNNPYPLTFNKGLLSGFSFKHYAINQISEINDDTLLIEKVI